MKLLMVFCHSDYFCSKAIQISGDDRYQKEDLAACDAVISIDPGNYHNYVVDSREISNKIGYGKTTNYMTYKSNIVEKSTKGLTNNTVEAPTSYSSRILIVAIEDIWKYPAIQRMILDKKIVSITFIRIIFIFI